MNPPLTRRAFLTAGAGALCAGVLAPGPGRPAFARGAAEDAAAAARAQPAAGEPQLFVDDALIGRQSGVTRRTHAARKRDRPVLEGEKPWETFAPDGAPRPYVATYGTALHDAASGEFRLWYNAYQTTCYATSRDGVTWARPPVNLRDGSNVLDLFGFHSPSIVLDRHDPDPARRYKAIGSKEGFPPEAIARLKARFRSSAWYSRRHAYAAAYSADGLRWTPYPEPALMGMDTITLAQDPGTGEFLAFHKNTQDPRSRGRQILLAVSRDLQAWSEPDLVLATDEEDHQAARRLAGGSHAEFYNLSAFRLGSHWLGLVTLFRCIGEPLRDGKARAGQKGLIDVQLVHSRDGRRWSRCSDRSPVIPLGPHAYDAGLVAGVCNTPVFVGDEMWLYYTGSTHLHSGGDPDVRVSIGLAAWRREGLVSLAARGDTGTVETIPLQPAGTRLAINAGVARGRLTVEVLEADGRVIPGYTATECAPLGGDGVRQAVRWGRREHLPAGRPLRLRFHLNNGDLHAFVIT